MIRELSYENIEAMLGTLSVIISFVDEDDMMWYFNKASEYFLEVERLSA